MSMPMDPGMGGDLARPKVKTGRPSEMFDWLTNKPVPAFICQLTKSQLADTLQAISPVCETQPVANPMDAYELLQIVGKGAFGKVFKVSNTTLYIVPLDICASRQTLTRGPLRELFFYWRLYHSFLLTFNLF